MLASRKIRMRRPRVSAPCAARFAGLAFRSVREVRLRRVELALALRRVDLDRQGDGWPQQQSFRHGLSDQLIVGRESHRLAQLGRQRHEPRLVTVTMVFMHPE